MAVLTSKHHDGFELWPSPNSFNWNSQALGPKQDLVGAFLNATRAKGIKAGAIEHCTAFISAVGNCCCEKWRRQLYTIITSLTAPCCAGLYHSIFEWFNPLYRGPNASQYVEEKLIPDLHAIVSKYEPAMLLMDGEWEQTSDFWQTKPFLAWLFNESPIKDTVVVNDR